MRKLNLWNRAVAGMAAHKAATVGVIAAVAVAGGGIGYTVSHNTAKPETSAKTETVDSTKNTKKTVASTLNGKPGTRRFPDTSPDANATEQEAPADTTESASTEATQNTSQSAKKSSTTSTSASQVQPVTQESDASIPKRHYDTLSGWPYFRINYDGFEGNSEAIRIHTEWLEEQPGVIDYENVTSPIQVDLNNTQVGTVRYYWEYADNDPHLQYAGWGATDAEAKAASNRAYLDSIKQQEVTYY